MNGLSRLVSPVLLVAAALMPAVAQGQGILVPRQPIPIPGAYAIGAVEVDVRLKDQIATVQVNQTFSNPSSAAMEVQFLFPLPYDSAIDQMTLLVDGKEFPARLLKRDEARRIYEEIVRRRRDPALLEYMGRGTFQTSVFPLPAGAQRQVTIKYTQLCRKDVQLTDFLFPLTAAKHSAKAIEKLRITARVQTTGALKSIYSPTHNVTVTRHDDHTATCQLEQTQVVPTEDFRLFFDTAEGAVGTSVLSYRPVGEDGYFLLLASPERKPSDAHKPRKSVVFVVDRSGSMSGKKIEQAKGALRFVLNNLREGDTFNIVAYDSAVESFRPELERFDEKTRAEALAFVAGLYAGGSTNIDGALKTAMGMLVDRSRPSYVIFLTDGLPTAGETREAAVVESARKANGAAVRLFAFGVGYDVNSRLLDKLARGNHGLSEYVRPNEDIEARVSRFYAKIDAPVLTGVSVAFSNEAPVTAAEPAPIYLTLPRELPDLFEGEQMVWVGRYRKAGTVKVTLAGTMGDARQEFHFPATLAAETTDETYGFVAKLWAMRRVGEIIDELDLKGHNSELVDELVALSIKHGILTPYTSFLADERTDLAAIAVTRARATRELMQLDESAGRAGFGQRRAKNMLLGRKQVPQAAAAPAGAGQGQAGGAGTGGGGSVAGQRAVYFDRDGNEVAAANVQVLGQKTFFLRNKRWYDSSVTKEQEKKAIVLEQFSDAYFALAQKHGATLAKYLAFREPVMLNLGGHTYQIDPPAK